jgi:hypothetical protein
MRANISLEGLSSEELLEDWAWLLRNTFTLIALNNFGDMFLRDEGGKVHFLELATGQVTTIAESMEEFQRLSEDKNYRARWFLLGLLTELDHAGMAITKGECFGFKKPPVLGGRIELSNIEITQLSVYASLMGQIHQQVRNLPPGAKIKEIKIG